MVTGRGMVQLLSAEGEIFPLEIKAAQMSKTLETIIEELDEGGILIIPLPQITSKVLLRIIQWADHHKDDATPEDESKVLKRYDDLSQWDLDFFTNMEHDSLLELSKAARELQIKRLEVATCKLIQDTVEETELQNEHGSEQRNTASRNQLISEWFMRTRL